MVTGYECWYKLSSCHMFKGLTVDLNLFKFDLPELVNFIELVYKL